MDLRTGWAGDVHLLNMRNARREPITEIPEPINI